MFSQQSFLSFIRKYTILFILVSLTGLVSGQGYFVAGKVLDKKSKETLPGAEVSLQLKADTTQLYSTISGRDGSFNLRVPYYGNYQLESRFLGYKSHTEDVNITANQTDTLFIEIPLRAEAFVIREVEVVKARNAIKVKEDTIEYNADAYVVNEDATVGDLLSKMPGIDVDDDGVTAYGEEVVRILVDGEEFFTGDPGIALNNLPADIVDKIEVIDKLSDQAEFSGFDDGNREKTINIKTINGRVNGYFGNFYAGVDPTLEYYNAGLNVNSFSGSCRLTVLGSSNNINDKGFFSRDNMGLAGGSMSGGISTTHSVGANFNDSWGEKWKVNGNYFYSHVNSVDEDTTSRTSFITDTTNNYYNSKDRTERTNQNHRVNFRIENKMNDRNRLIITPSASVQGLESQGSETGITLSNDESLLNMLESNSDNESSGYNVAGNVLYMHRFNRAGRTVSLNLDGSENHTDQDKINKSLTNYYQTGSQEIVNQESVVDNDSKGFGFNATYTEPLGKKTQLMVSYQMSQKQELTDQSTNSYDSLLQTYSVIDSSLSGNSDHHTNSQSVSLGFRYNLKRIFHVSATAGLKIVNLFGNQDFEEYAETDKTFNNIESRVELNYRKSNKNNLRVSYDGQAQLPSISDMFVLIDNSNPLYITQGNADLDPAYTHSLRGNWRITNEDFTSFALINVEGKLTQDYIGDYIFTAEEDTIIDNTVELSEGSSLSRKENCGTSNTMSVNFSYSRPFYLVKSNLSFDCSFSYSHLPSYLNDIKYYSDNNNISSSIKLASNSSKKFDYEFSYRAGYSIIKSSVQSAVNQNYYTGNVNLRLYYVPITRFVVNTDVSMKHYIGIDMADDNEVLWNASLAWKFLKHNYGELKLSVYDILKANTSISRTITNNYIEDKESNVLQQYFMLTFSYKLKHIGA